MAKEVQFYASRAMKSKFKSWKLLHGGTTSMDTYYDLDIMEAMEHYAGYCEKIAKKRIEAAIQQALLELKPRHEINGAVEQIFKLCRSERRERIALLRRGISERHRNENGFSDQK